MEKMLVRGVTKDTDVARISMIGVSDIPGIAFKVFNKLAQKNINVDIILQSVGRNATKDIAFTVNKDNAPVAIAALRELPCLLIFLDHFQFLVETADNGFIGLTAVLPYKR